MVGPRLTDRRAIWLALHLASEYEESLIDAYSHFDAPENEPAVIQARKRIAAFKRVLGRYYEGEGPPSLPSGEPISIWKVMRRFTPEGE